jgi:DNA-binding NtrC family response regulator
MVVDDEPALVALAEEVLADLGYEPAGFRDPALALEVLRRVPERFDALLTDQLMPGVSGMELAQAMHALRPDAPILLTTGFSGGDLDERAARCGEDSAVQDDVGLDQFAEFAHVCRPQFGDWQLAASQEGL